MGAKRLIFGLGALLLLLAGCTTTGDRPEKPQFVGFKVNASPLDRVKLIYHPAPNNPKWKQKCTIDISGSGMLELRSGKSERVNESFWQKPEAENWSDMHYDRLNLQPADTQLLLQRIVDCGAFPHKESIKLPEIPPAPYVIVYAQIGRHRAVQIKADPRFFRIAELLLAEFEADNLRPRR